MAEPNRESGQLDEHAQAFSPHTGKVVTPTAESNVAEGKDRMFKPPEAPSSPHTKPAKLTSPTGGEGTYVTPPSPVKGGKPGYAEFFVKAEAIVSDPSAKSSVTRLMRLLKTGFSDRLQPEHLYHLSELLQTWAECSRLALNLYLETRRKRSNELMRGLRNKLLTDGRTRVEYPDTNEADGSSENRAVALLRWLDIQFTHDSSEKREKQPHLDLDRARWAFLSLAEETDADVRSDGIYRLLDRLAGSPTPSELHQAELEFISEIGGLFSTEKPNLQKLRSSLHAAGAARSIGDRHRTELRKTQELLAQSRERADELTLASSELERDLEGAHKQLRELEAACQRKDREIEEQQQERLLDQEHWQHQGEQQLSKVTNSIRARVGHEVSEAKISLSLETPNIRMALERLNRIEKALERLKEE